MLATRPVASTPLAATGAAALKLSLGASEARDIANIRFSDKFAVSIKATEAADTASMSMRTGRTIRITASEAIDTAAFALDSRDKFTIAASEARDTASISLRRGMSFSFWATEASDVASMRLGLTSRITLSVSEARDTASFVLQRPSSMIMNATEQPDRATLNFIRSPLLTIAAKEAQDTMLLVLNNQNVRIIASETKDTASFRLNLIIGVRCAAKETPDSAEIYIAPRWWEIEGTRCCTRWTEASRPDSQYVDLGELVISATEAPDVFSGIGFDARTGYILLDRQAHTTPFVLGSTPDDYILLESGGGYIRGDG